MVSALIPFYNTSSDKLLQILSHIFLFKMFFNDLENSFGGQMWFVSTIIQFYLIWPFLLKLFNKSIGVIYALLISMLWATIYCQQILLGMLTIFGPIQWAFSLLPKWEGAWAKWMTRYLTVHFYGAMLYFVGFYVLLLFDIVLCIQVENLTAITASEQTMAAYLQNSFFSAGYLMAASIVALKCLNLVPDLAAWMIPEGDTAFSTRNFGEGVAQQAKMSATGAMHSLMR